MQPGTEPDIYVQHIKDKSYTHHMLAGLPEVECQVANSGPSKDTLQ
jgi:hypothetical protein